MGETHGIFHGASEIEDALRLGAYEVVVSRHANQMQTHTSIFDFILDCVSADHDIDAYPNLLARDGGLTLVGAPEKPISISAGSTTSPPMSK